MSERLPENIVLCIDTSRSMFRTDYQPNRFKASINAIKKLINERFTADPMTFFSIVRFSDKAKKLIDFTNSKEDLFRVLDSLKISGYSTIGEALGIAIKMIIIELRKIQAKTPRILVVTDGKYQKNSVDPLKMARLAQNLRIKIDTFRLGDYDSINILKRMSDLTGGKYYYNNDANSLMRAAMDLANSNIKTYGESEESPIENPMFLRQIAADLLRVQDLTKDQEQRLLQIRGLANYKKCSICFSDTNPFTKSSFYVSGRYCPNCQTPFHIHCLANWAEYQKDSNLKKAGVVRCPHCFYLLKIPLEITQLQKLKLLSKKRGVKPESEEGPKIFEAKKINFEDLDTNAIFSSCPVCNLIFEEGQKIVKCGNCGTHYHDYCFLKLENGICKNCGVKLKLNE